ncbi:hypothetical protein [Microvirga antarctica]|uniref:hypothetical protein n=1 Tax=Microvirga antarctica TaxID=2819233 RepID=UPI001B30C346|nr:hypothetical protein [Microvirga antarctica]
MKRLILATALAAAMTPALAEEKAVQIDSAVTCATLTLMRSSLNRPKGSPYLKGCGEDREAGIYYIERTAKIDKWSVSCIRKEGAMTCRWTWDHHLPNG